TDHEIDAKKSQLSAVIVVVVFSHLFFTYIDSIPS
ncbi:MAG: hypothetical protein ACI90V_014286, partial [Bacillariaceae sp.]